MEYVARKSYKNFETVDRDQHEMSSRRPGSPKVKRNNFQIQNLLGS